MKILFVSDTYYPHINGVYYFVCRIGPMLQQRGHEVAVIAPSATRSFSKTKIDDLGVYALPSWPVLLYPSVRIPVPILLKSRVKKIIRAFNPDIIHLQDHFSISNAVIAVNKKLNIPIIGTNHFMPENLSVFIRREKLKRQFESFLWKGFSKTFNKVNLVTTPTETGAQLIRPHLNIDAIAISSGISLEEFNPLGDTDKIKEKYSIPDKPIILFVGRLDPEKHIEEILQAVAISIKLVDFCFIVVGKGIRKTALEELTHQLGITDNVIFTGFVPDEDLPYFYKLSRCFIIASIAELLSLATLQAMASGLPVIAVNAGALGELVKHTKNGYLFNEGDINTIVKHIESIITNDNLCREMSEKSLEYVQYHDIHGTVDSFEQLYKLQTRQSFPIRREIIIKDLVNQ
jgi:1,2-diacylglycerol 3-alpha-glucosyltransferase